MGKFTILSKLLARWLSKSKAVIYTAEFTESKLGSKTFAAWLNSIFASSGSKSMYRSLSKLLANRRIGGIFLSWSLRRSSSFVRIIGKVFDRILLSKRRFISSLRKTPRSWQKSAFSGSHNPSSNAIVLLEDTIEVAGTQMINPYSFGLKNMKTAAPSKLKNLLNFIGGVLAFDVAGRIFDDLFFDDEEEEEQRGSAGGSSEDSYRREVNGSEFSGFSINRAIRAAASNTSMRNPPNDLLYALVDIVTEAIFNMTSKDNDGDLDIVTVIDVLVTMISNSDRSEVLRAHAINKLLAASATDTNDVFSDLRYNVNQETAEVLSAAYIYHLRSCKDEYQRNIAEEDLKGEDSSISSIALMPTMTVSGDFGIWNFDSDFEMDDVNKLSMLDEHAASNFIPNMVYKISSEDVVTLSKRSRILTISGSVD